MRRPAYEAKITAMRAELIDEIAKISSSVIGEIVTLHSHACFLWLAVALLVVANIYLLVTR